MGERILKPCPFCGCMAKVGTIGSFYRVYCDGPFCDVRPNTRFHKSKKESIEAWNRRVDSGNDETDKY